MENKASVLMQRYELGRLLGQGTFAKVYFARSLRTSQGVAVKVIDKEKIVKAGLIDQIKREVSVMRLVRHPSIVQLYEVMATKSKIYFVLEYVKGGELFDKVAKGRLKEEVAKKYFQQLINAVDFCHSRGVCHRDLKPENLLLDENENLKVSDFGLSALAESKLQDGLLHTACGTPAYVAPEVISRKGYDGPKADTWSCGVILFVLLAGFLPFHDSNLMEMYRKIRRAEFRCPNWFSLEVRKLLAKILDPNPNTRITIARIKESSWFRRGFSSKLAKPQESKGKAPLIPSGDSSGTAEKNLDVVEPKHLTAFDIITLSDGFDLSGFFKDNCRREVKFTSRRPASNIISKLEEIARLLGFRLRKRDAGLLKLKGLKEGRKGVLSIDAEIFEVAPAFHLVDVKKSNGDTLEYEKILKEDIRPALQDIVWAWLGDQQQEEQSQSQL